MIEKSKAIKCPTVAYQLAGCKRIQQQLFQSGVVEKYLMDKSYADKIRAVFVEQYSFDVIEMIYSIIENLKWLIILSFKDQNLDELICLVQKDFENYVLKPQREGGGNKFFGSEIK